jgi:glucosamine-6-phosphate deaminase
VSCERRVDAGWAELAAAALRQRLAESPHSRLCLATGSTPLPLYDRVAAAPDDFAAASVLLLDEFGGLPADEPARCDAVLRRALIDRVRPAAYRSIDVDAADLDAERAAIDAWIDDGGIDLAVLGLGVNGHLGMNEPRSPVEGRTARVELAPSTIDGARRYFEGRHRPTWGVTVGLGDLLRARAVWVLAAGPTKAAIVARGLEGPVTTDVPASLLQDHRGCTWWLDPAAAADLGGSRRTP